MEKKLLEITSQINHFCSTQKTKYWRIKMAQLQDNTTKPAVQELLENGYEGLKEAVVLLLNEGMRIERSQVLNALPFQRTEERKGYANGFKNKLG